MTDSNDLNAQIISSLEDLKGKDIITLDVSDKTDVTDTLIIASGTSNRHVKSLASNVVEDLKKQMDIRPMSMEGEDQGEWVLVDYVDTVVHVMLPQAREFYDLEKLWSAAAEKRPDSE
ncbi:MAG: ribosome silencing factor [Cellvibrionaceae bacterium]